MRYSNKYLVARNGRSGREKFVPKSGTHLRQLFILLVFLISTLRVCFAQNLASGEQIDVFLVIGQSNAAGRGNFIEEDIELHTGIYLLNNHQTSSFGSSEKFELASISLVSGAITNSGDGQSHSFQKYAGYNRYSWVGKSLNRDTQTGEVGAIAEARQGYGIANAFGQAVRNLTGNNVGLVVNARGAATLDQWLSTSTEKFADTMDPTKNLFDNTLDRVGDMLLKYPNAVLKGVIWMQGETEQLDYLKYQSGQTTRLQDYYGLSGSDLDDFINQRFTDYKTKFIDHLVSPLRGSLNTRFPNSAYDKLPFFVVKFGEWDFNLNSDEWGITDAMKSSQNEVMVAITNTFRDDNDNWIDVERNFDEINTALESIPDRENENYIYLIESSDTQPLGFCSDSPDPENNFYCFSDQYSWQPKRDGIHYDRSSLELLGQRAAEKYMEVADVLLDQSSLLAHYPMNIYLHNNYKEHRYRVNNSKGKIKVTGDEFLELRHWDVSGHNRHGSYYGVNPSAGTENYVQPTPPFFPMYDRQKLTIQATKNGVPIPKPGTDTWYNYFLGSGETEYFEKTGRVNPDFNFGQDWITWKKWENDAVQVVKKLGSTDSYMAIPQVYALDGQTAEAVNQGFSASFWTDINPGDTKQRRILTTRFYGVDKLGASIIVKYLDNNNVKQEIVFDLSSQWSGQNKQMYFFALSNSAGTVTLYAKNFDDLANEETGDAQDRNLVAFNSTAQTTFAANTSLAFSDQSAIMSESFKGRIWNVRFFNKAMTAGQAGKLFGLDMTSIDYKIQTDKAYDYSPLHYVNTNRLKYYGKGAEHKGERFFDDYNEVEGYTISFWVDIDEDYDSGRSPVPFDDQSSTTSFFNVSDGTNTLMGMERKNDALGINRYYVDTYGERLPWYYWFYDPASFNKKYGQGRYHIVMAYYPNIVRVYMFKPGKNKYDRRLAYAGAQDLSMATSWEVNKDVTQFSAYNWTLDSLEVNAVHYFDQQNQYDSPRNLYDYDPTTELDETYFPSFAIVGDFGCVGGGCEEAGDQCPVPDIFTDDPNLTRQANPEAVRDMVKLWNPDFILSVGGNSYNDPGYSCRFSFIENVSALYADYLPNDDEEFEDEGDDLKFYPVPGDPDYYHYLDDNDVDQTTLWPYQDYFNQCDAGGYAMEDVDFQDAECSGETTGRYYTFRQGNVRFFMINTSVNEIDGIKYDANYDPTVELTKTTPNRDGLQAWWFKQQIERSQADPDETFQVVLMHTPPYSVNYDDGSLNGGFYDVYDAKTDEERQQMKDLRWPFKAWGVDAIIAGGDHNYQEIDMGGIPLFINGLGGHPEFQAIRQWGLIEDGTAVASTDASLTDAYAGNFGAMKGRTDADNLYLDFYSIDGTVKSAVVAENDPLAVPPPAPARFSLPEAEPKPELSVYPNATSDYVNIALVQDEPIEGVIEVIGLDGRSYYRSDISLNSGNHSLSLDLRPMLKGVYGIYILRVTTGTQQVSKKVIYSGGNPEEEE